MRCENVPCQRERERKRQGAGTYTRGEISSQRQWQENSRGGNRHSRQVRVRRDSLLQEALQGRRVADGAVREGEAGDLQRKPRVQST